MRLIEWIQDFRKHRAKSKEIDAHIRIILSGRRQSIPLGKLSKEDLNEYRHRIHHQKNAKMFKDGESNWTLYNPEYGKIKYKS